MSRSRGPSLLQQIMRASSAARAAARLRLAAPLLVMLAGGCHGSLVPTSGTPLSPTRLKYVLDARWTIFFCDPDYYPIARGDELTAAVQKFPTIAADTEKYAAILEHLGFAGQSALTDSAKLRVYREDKRLATIALTPDGERYTFQLREQESKGSAFAVTGVIDRYGNIDVQNRTATIATCPICLSGDARIATPVGDVPVRAVVPGMEVWTLGADGRRVRAKVLRVGHVPVAPGHEFVRLRLADGRTVLVSPGHPTPDGRHVGELVAGDTLAGTGSRVVSATRIPARDSATFDLLPDGPTGVYWANGILLGSTLAVGQEYARAAGRAVRQIPMPR